MNISIPALYPQKIFLVPISSEKSGKMELNYLRIFAIYKKIFYEKN